MPKPIKNPKDNTCDHCHGQILAMQSICTEIEGNRVELCGSCWNAFIAQKTGIDFKTIELKPIRLKDCDGKSHEFHFMTHMVPSGLAIDAREAKGLDDIGYEFSVFGTHDCNQADLILDLYQKIKRGISKKYLKKDRRFGILIKDSSVVGRIEWDDDYGGEIPSLVIDGQRMTWEKLGRMLMSFEGWQFKLDIFDKSDEPQ